MRRGGSLPVLLGLLLVAGCGGASPIPAEDHWIGVEVGADAALPGQAFPVTVTRIWRKDLAAAAWDDGLLAPLDVRLESLVREEDAVRVRERRRFRAYAFSLADVVVPPVAFAARPAAGGEAETVDAPSFTVRMRPTLLPTAPGAPELPGEPLADPPSRAPWIGLGLGLALLAGLGLVAARRRGRRPVVEPPPPEPPAPAAHEVALERLARLGDDGGDVVRATEIVRAYVADRFDVPAPYLSTEEVLAACRLDVDVASRLAALLALGDRTKFAAYAPSAPERHEHLDDAADFVRRTAAGATS